jgi:hypothetical protein
VLSAYILTKKWYHTGIYWFGLISHFWQKHFFSPVLLPPLLFSVCFLLRKKHSRGLALITLLPTFSDFFLTMIKFCVVIDILMVNTSLISNIDYNFIFWVIIACDKS